MDKLTNNKRTNRQIVKQTTDGNGKLKNEDFQNR